MTGKNQNNIDTNKIKKDDDSTREYIREQLKELKETFDDTTSKFQSIEVPEKNSENFFNSVSTKIFGVILGVVLTSLISLNVWLINQQFSDDKRITLLEENFKTMQEFRQDIKEIKEDLNDVKVKVVVIQQNLGVK